jgi:hypothetical protein
MKEQIMQNLGAVIAALNSVCVSGEDNFANMAGSLRVLRQVCEMIAASDVTEKGCDEKQHADEPEA